MGRVLLTTCRMNPQRLARLFIFVLMAALLLPSCHTRRSIIKAPLKEEGAAYLLERLDHSELKFDWFSARFSARFSEGNKSTDLRGQIRIRKDSVIWISFSPALGIEMARLMITQDSVVFMNRIDKIFFEGDYQFVNRFLGTSVDFDMIQALVIGNDFQFYETSTFRAAVDGGEYRLSTTGRRKTVKMVEEDPVPLIQNIWLDPESFKISRVDMKEYGGDSKKLEVRYEDFVKLNDQRIPSKLSFLVTGDQKISLSIRYTRTAHDEAVTFPFSIPSEYQRLR